MTDCELMLIKRMEKIIKKERKKNVMCWSGCGISRGFPEKSVFRN